MNKTYENYYSILEITQNAESSDIESAYLRQVRKYHPDRNKSPEAEEKMHRINEAYSVLKDTHKRQLYDNYGDNWQNQSENTGTDHFRGFEQIFEEFFGYQQKRRGKDYQYTISITLEDSLKGKTVEINIPKGTINKCETCSGTGAKDKNIHKCDRCQGQGFTQTNHSFFFKVQQTCSKCKGTKNVIANPCNACQTKGFKYANKIVKINIPAGIKNKECIHLKQQGQEILKGRTGDLYAFITVEKHPKFWREGDNLCCIHKISVWDACLGCEHSLQILQSQQVDIKIKPETQYNEKIIYPNLGFPNTKDGKVGSLCVYVQFTIPPISNTEHQNMLSLIRKKTVIEKK